MKFNMILFRSVKCTTMMMGYNEKPKNTNQNMVTNRPFIATDRQPWISTFDRSHARQKRSNVSSIHGRVLISYFCALIVAHSDAFENMVGIKKENFMIKGRIYKLCQSCLGWTNTRISESNSCLRYAKIE